MTHDHIQYALNSGAWFLGGCVVTAIYLRWYGRRQLRLTGAMKEPPLAVFTAILVGIVTLAGLLFAESARLQQTAYEQCQATVNQQFRDGYAERVKIAAQDRDAIDDTFRRILTSPLDKDDVRRILRVYFTARAKSDEQRRQNPVVVSGDCKKPNAGR